MKTEILSYFLNKVEAELTDKDREVITKYVEEIEPPNCYLEIGVKHGGSALVAKCAAKEGVEVYGIDSYPQLQFDGREEETGIHL